MSRSAWEAMVTVVGAAIWCGAAIGRDLALRPSCVTWERTRHRCRDVGGTLGEPWENCLKDFLRDIGWGNLDDFWGNLGITLGELS